MKALLKKLAFKLSQAINLRSSKNLIAPAKEPVKRSTIIMLALICLLVLAENIYIHFVPIVILALLLSFVIAKVNKHFWITMLVFTLPILIMLGLYMGYKHFYPDIPGYCYSQKRFISDEEFIRLAVKRLMSSFSDAPSIENSESFIWSYHREHPDCCSVYKPPAGKEWYGLGEVHIYIHYKTKYPSSDESSKTPYEYSSFIIFDECGEYMGEFGGE